MKNILVRVLAIAAVAVLGWMGFRFVRQLPDRQREVATAEVRRSDVIVQAFARGELQAVRQITLTAPNLFGTVQVTRLAPLGAFARRGDLVVEFDDAEVQSRLEEDQLELAQTEERIKKSEADLAISANEDEVELLQARYTVRRAELEVKRNELLSAIEQRKNNLNLDEAQRRLEKLKSDIESRRAQAEAELNVLRETRRQSELELQQEQTRLGQVKVLSPMDGLVAIRQARTHFFFAGSQMPDIREGDELHPGIAVADILDLSELEVVARVGELDRANLTEGQDVVIRLDALPDKELHGKIKGLSGTATADVYSNDPAKKFDVTFEIDMDELMDALGATPEQIERIRETAEKNRSRGLTRSSGDSGMSMMGGGGFPGGGFPGGGQAGGFAGGGQAGGFPGGGQAEGSSGGRSFPGATGGGQRGAGRRAPGNMNPTQMISRLPDAEKQKAQEILDKALDGKTWDELADDKKSEVTRQLSSIMRSAFSAMRAGGGAPGAGGGMPSPSGSSSGFTAAQKEAAELPPPPEEDSQLDVLLRPGLLADVEILVENIPDAIHIPVQAIFERNGQPMVYVQEGKRFVEREIRPLKRSESIMVIAEGLKEGEVVALADPNAAPGESQEQSTPSNGNPMQGFGGGFR